jgi:flagellar hook-length control protein FliK
VRSAFDFSLEPQGLGRVDVSLKIDPQGQLQAVFAFDNAAVAAEARSRAGDLQQALQQAGFDVSQSGLSFTSGGGQGHGAAFSQGAGQALYAGPSFADAPPELPAPILASLAAAPAAGGLDITI